VSTEPEIVVEHREELWYLLTQAAQLEHMIMCQYLYAAFSLKAEPDEGLTPQQLDACRRWRAEVNAVAVEEMLHLALVCNLTAAIGAAPSLSRPNFPQRTAYFPPSVELDLLPFGDAALRHFLYLERPEGVERPDADEFMPSAVGPTPMLRDEIVPRSQSFATVGHLYRGISRGFERLVERFGEDSVFVGPRRAQATPESFQWSQLISVVDLPSAQAAIAEIIEQGEGARGDWRDAHYGRFLRMHDEYAKMVAADPSFVPARPVVPAYGRQPFDISGPVAVLEDSNTAAVSEVFNVGYEVLLQTLTRFFTHTDESDGQLKTLADLAIGLMATVLRPAGSALTRLPVGSGADGRTAGPTFEMFYQMGNFLPDRGAAWRVLEERYRVLADRCGRTEGLTHVAAGVLAMADRLNAAT
jgi:hypothetical protein